MKSKHNLKDSDSKAIIIKIVNFGTILDTKGNVIGKKYYNFLSYYFCKLPFKMLFPGVTVWKLFEIYFMKVCHRGIETWLSQIPTEQLYSI